MYVLTMYIKRVRSQKPNRILVNISGKSKQKYTQYNNITRHQCQNVEKLQKSGKTFVKEPFKKIKVFREINDAFQTRKLLMTEFYRYSLHVTCS